MWAARFVCSHSLDRNLTGMAIADITLLSGFEVDIPDLEVVSGSLSFPPLDHPPCKETPSCRIALNDQFVGLKMSGQKCEPFVNTKLEFYCNFLAGEYKTLQDIINIGKLGSLFIHLSYY